jgi:phosphatidylserine synthase
MITTRIGEACMLGALLILLQVNVQSLKRITASKTYTNHEFLLFLKQEQVRLERFKRHTQVAGFIIASVGLSLYVFEAVHQQPATALITYAGVLAWCLFSWFIIRPIALRKKTKQLQQMVQQLEQYTNQLKQEL